MKRIAAGGLMTLLVGCTIHTARSPQLATPPFPGKQFEHVLIVILENEDNATVLANPYMKKLAEGGRRFANYSGLFHPSYPNYLALVAGNFFNTRADWQKDIDARTIADLLEEHHLSWRQYAEDYPGGQGQCFVRDSAAGGLYRRKHVPFLSFTSIQKTARCDYVVAPAKPFDAHKLPNYAFFTPNMQNDGHDTSLEFAANWLQGFLDPIRADPDVMKDTLIVVTFDESGSQRGNQIYTVFLGGMVKPGVEEAHYDHYNLLRTIEDNFGLGTLHAQDAASAPIVGAWKEVP